MPSHTAMTSTPRTVTKQSETRSSVLDLIEQLGVGDAIPSERQLCVDLGVSRLTVRAALDDLVRDGMLVRRHGSGTFVSEPKIAQELTMTSFTEDMLRRGMVPGEQDARSPGDVPAGAHLGRLLHVSPSEPVVIISRLRLADHETMAIETLHVRESLVPGISRRRPRAPVVLRDLQGRFGIEIVGGLQTIEPTVTNEEESDALGVPLHSPAFLFERTTRAASGEIVEFVRSIYRGDRYKLVTELNRGPPGRHEPEAASPSRLVSTSLAARSSSRPAPAIRSSAAARPYPRLAADPKVVLTTLDCVQMFRPSGQVV